MSLLSERALPDRTPESSMSESSCPPDARKASVSTVLLPMRALVRLWLGLPSKAHQLI
jgi:hypothetical protein